MRLFVENPRYSLINLQQNSPEWHDFRDCHLGGSDAPIILGASPWCLPRELYLQKTPFAPPKKPMTWQMKRGQDLEDKARDCLESQVNIKFKPVVMEYVDYPFISCSLDGISEDGNVICEIKCPNEKTHKESIDGNIPIYYNIQIQHALMVSGAEYCLYFSYRPEYDIPTALVKIQPNTELMLEILTKEIDFWDRVVNLRGIDPIELTKEED